jgi:hypothetical protein
MSTCAWRTHVLSAPYRDALSSSTRTFQAEGWNPGLHDDVAFYAADPHGFLIALIDSEPVGCISAVR